MGLIFSKSRQVKLSFYNAIALLTFTACSNDYPIGNEEGEELNMPVFTASLKDNYSRAHLTSAFSIYWNEDDRISVFAKSTDNTEYRLSDGANSRSATFHAVETKNLGATSLPLNGAVYPYDANNKIKSVAQGYEFSFNIPFEQIYTPESFDRSAFPMVAISENTSLQFRNVCGMLMLQLSGKRKIASIALKGKENEVCAGWGTLLHRRKVSKHSTK